MYKKWEFYFNKSDYHHQWDVFARNYKSKRELHVIVAQVKNKWFSKTAEKGTEFYIANDPRLINTIDKVLESDESIYTKLESYMKIIIKEGIKNV